MHKSINLDGIYSGINFNENVQEKASDLIILSQTYPVDITRHIFS